jgi:uncharacterized protein with PIN domain
MAKAAQFRFYEELNDFLPDKRKKTLFSYPFEGNPAIKDTIEAIGVPHTEIDLILVNGSSVSFHYKLKNNDHVSVYPVFESFDISEISRLRNEPLRNPKFILDVHLGKLAKYLRMAGLDTLYENYYTDSEIVKISKKEKRIILTRDIGILKFKDIRYGYWIRSQNPTEQFGEIVRRFDLPTYFKPFYRCINCNGLIRKTTKKSVLNILQPKTRKFYHEFYQCESCNKVYWKGSHFDKMVSFIDNYSSEEKTKDKPKASATGLPALSADR